MSGTSKFITNDKVKKLVSRINTLIQHSSHLKFLVGFFYFSGLQALYKALKEKPDIKLDVLVGLNIDRTVHGIYEYGESSTGLTGRNQFDSYLNSLSLSLNSDEFDTQEFYEQSKFFIDMLKEDKLCIRKTYKPNHSKLYFFKMDEENKQLIPASFITGSSNLTRSGLSAQNELNVELRDFGTEEAEEYFDKLWEDSLPITENDVLKKELITLLEEKTLITKITPYEAYALVLKTWLELQGKKTIKDSVLQLLKRKGYKIYKYQTDAAAQALSIIEKNQGVIVSDVVGLGKSIIAGMIARNLGLRGIIICPPGLIGDENKTSGWRKYREDFQLHDWEIRSCGLESLRKTLDLVRESNDYDVVIIDEAHRFRNQDTESYDLLQNICRDKIVILLSATPFNNTPADIFALLKLFIVPGKSSITLTDNLDFKFRSYNNTFKRLSNIRKNYNSSDVQKRKKAETDYQILFGSGDIDLVKVKERAGYLSQSIREVISKVTIRRNRIDLKKDPEYSKEIYELSEVKDPCEIFYTLTPDQSAFYDRVVTEYFGEEGSFTGAVYQPYIYQAGRLNEDGEGLSETENREYQIQRNLADFMRRLLVKRFESSFGAFRQSISNFIAIYEKAKAFIENSGGYYILDRKLLEKIYDSEFEEIQEALQDFESNLDPVKEKRPKNDQIYNIEEFTEKGHFLKDIQGDINLFTTILQELDELELVKNDPKTHSLGMQLREIIAKKDDDSEPQRKAIIFTEYIDTVKYLEPYLCTLFPDACISVKGDLNTTKMKTILENFDASHKKQSDEFSILLTTDKLSEGVNLNRAGAVINYDIPWNPTRVIQRVGRINRISKRMFENLYIYNFFPTVQGETYQGAEKLFLKRI